MEQNFFGHKVVAITGASGLLGAHLCIALLQQGVQVRAIVRNAKSQQKAESFFRIYSCDDLLHLNITWLYADITNMLEISDAIEGADFVFHCAGYVSFDTYESAKLYTINTCGTQHVVDACLKHNVQKMCYISSIAALGKPENNELLQETHDFDVHAKTKSAYGYSKYLGELEVQRGIAEGLPAVIVNPSVVIGPGQWNQSSGALFSTMYNFSSVYTSAVSGYVSVHDVVDCMIQLMASDVSGEKFIISAQNVDMKTVSSVIAETLGVRKPRIHIPKCFLMIVSRVFSSILHMIGKPSKMSPQTAQAAYQKTYIDNSKIQDSLSFSFRDVIQEIRKTAEIYKKQYDLPSKK
ncbi:MAG: NAD-dependent epimerase/dehydratase family protein [Bacteroidales bacterium]